MSHCVKQAAADSPLPEKQLKSQKRFRESPSKNPFLSDPVPEHLCFIKSHALFAAWDFLTESGKSPARLREAISRGGTCLYHKRDRLTYDKGYEQVAMRIVTICFDTRSGFYLGQRSSFFASGANG